MVSEPAAYCHGPGNSVRVAICMATFAPRIDLFERQIESIIAQTEPAFLCIVNDDCSSDATYAEIVRVCSRDARFVVSRNHRRQGFYANFARALSLVPPEVEYVAFSDQDDVWYPQKLEVLIGALREPGVFLAFSDMRIVDVTGVPIASSYWTDRRNNFTNLGSLLLVNTVTGAACVFRHELLKLALPFPVVPGRAYHDHWIALLALARGRISFVQRPLHDYVQHSGNVVGRHEPLPGELKGGLVRAVGRFLRNPRLRARNTLRHARRYYETEVVPRQILAMELDRRLGPDCPRRKRRVIRRVARLGSPGSLAWLIGRSARDIRGESETLGLENQLIKGIVWSWLRRTSPPVA